MSPPVNVVKLKQCGNDNFNITVQNDKNNAVMNPMCENISGPTCDINAVMNPMCENISVPTCDINEVPMILDPSLEKEINSLM